MAEEVLYMQDLELKLLKEDKIYFRLTGGLGNQLFGLSEAFNLHKILHRHVLVDVGSIQHVNNFVPEWLEWSKNQNWLTIIKIPNIKSSKYELINLGNQDIDVNGNSRFFTGWNFSLEKVEQSGLFLRSKFPFKVETKQPIPIALHFRAGDYADAAGIGILNHNYYARALRRLDLHSTVTVFTNDKFAAQCLINNLGIETRSKILEGESAIDVLYRLASAERFIGSNSTLSWWANYFSAAVTRFFPKPFYLQDWNFDSKAKFEDSIYLSRFANLKELIHTRIKWLFN